jgi:hypothetical protein
MRPADTKSVAKAIDNKTFAGKVSSMLVNYNKLPTYMNDDGINMVRLGVRKQLMIDSFGFLELVIQTERVYKDKSSVAVKATLFVCTEDGYQPVFTRLGYASVDDINVDTPHRNIVGYAESNAEKRVLQALGMPDVKPAELSTVRSRLEANKIKVSRYLNSEGVSLDVLVNTYNASASTPIKTMVLEGLSAPEADELVKFVKQAA